MDDSINSKLQTTLNSKDLSAYLSRQLYHFFPDEAIAPKKLLPYIEGALKRLHYCFSKINLPYFNREGSTLFNHLHGDQYAMFLYFLSNEAYASGGNNVYIKSSLLNKALHSLDLFGHVEMPDVFLLVHPVGTIIGRAEFQNYLVIYQNVTIGGIHDYSDKTVHYPKIDENISIYANSTILGKTHIRANSTIGANTFIRNLDIPESSLVTGWYPNNLLRTVSKTHTNLFA